MPFISKIVLLSLVGLAIFGRIDRVQAQWTGGPVLIGGDDIDNHFLNGKAYMKEGFNFLGSHVRNGNTIAAYIGYNPAKREQK